MTSRKYLLLCLASNFILFCQTIFASEQAKFVENSTFHIPNQAFSDEQVYDYLNNNYKKINGKNFYGIKNDKDKIQNNTLIFNYPKTEQGLKRKLEILTPDIKDSEILKLSSFYDIYLEKNEIHSNIYIPFLIGAIGKNVDTINNQLVIKNGELSSVNFIKPSTAPTKTFPINNPENDIFQYIISGALVENASAIHNKILIQNDSHINIGVENSYTLSPNGAPYIIGAMALNGKNSNNAVLFENNSNLCLHGSLNTKKDRKNKNTNISIAHIIGGYGINSPSQNNKIVFNGGNIVLHGGVDSYSTSASMRVIGGFSDNNNSKPYDSIENSIIVDNLNLKLKVETNNLSFYDAILFGDFFGGLTIRGNSLDNKIKIRNFTSTEFKEQNIQIQAMLNFYGGYSQDGESNGNQIEIDLKNPFKLNDNFAGENYFNIYGGYASKGANKNSIIINNDFTKNNIPQNFKDKLVIYAARTLNGTANENSITINNSVIAIPIYGYISEKTTLNNQSFIPNEANKNKISLYNVKSLKNLSFLIQAKEVNNNEINYNLVQSISEASSINKGSDLILDAENKANSNIININNFSSAAADNTYIIKARNESSFNKIDLKNTSFGTASDKREGKIYVVAGIAKKAHDNILMISDLNIDEYKNDNAIILAPAGIYNPETDNSYANTLYLNGYFSTYDNDTIDSISGTIIYKDNKIYNTDSTHLSRDNHIIIEAQNIQTKQLSNFENYSFIFSKNLFSNQELIKITDKPLILSSNGFIKFFHKNKFRLNKGDKIKLISSEKGFIDENKNTLNKKHLENFLNKMASSSKYFNYKNINNLNKALIYDIRNYKIEVSEDAKTIYLNIL